MSTIDIILIIIVAGAVIIGYRLGALRQIGSIGGVVAGVFACRVAGDRAAAIVASLTGADDPGASSMNEQTCHLLGNALLFLAVWCAVWLLARILRKATHALCLGPVDGVAGSAFLTFKWLLVVSLALNLWKFISPDSAIFSSSHLAGGAAFSWIMDMTPAVLGFLQDAATNT